MDKHAQRLELFGRTNQLREAEGYGNIWFGGSGLHYGFSNTLLHYAAKQRIDLWQVLNAYRATFDRFTVADIGCGRGDALREVKKRFGDAVFTVGFDVARLRAHATLDLFVKGDFEQIAMPQELRGACHFVVSDQVFTYFRDPAKGVENVRTLLVPTGQAYLDMRHATFRMPTVNFTGVVHIAPIEPHNGIPQEAVQMPRSAPYSYLVQDENYSLF